MEENKKRPLSEEELEQVAGGVQSSSNSDGFKGWRCSNCWQLFSTLEEAEEHEKNCPKKKWGNNAQRLLKPIIL